MLLKTNYRERSKSQYMCDRCKKELQDDRHRVISQDKYSYKTIKKWDLCRQML